MCIFFASTETEIHKSIMKWVHGDANCVFYGFSEAKITIFGRFGLQNMHSISNFQYFCFVSKANKNFLFIFLSNFIQEYSSSYLVYLGVYLLQSNFSMICNNENIGNELNNRDIQEKNCLAFSTPRKSVWKFLQGLFHTQLNCLNICIGQLRQLRQPFY